MSNESDCEKNLLQREIRKALGTSISMNTTLELIGSVHHQREKSEALVVLEPDREPEFLAPLSVGRLWGASPEAELLERARTRWMPHSRRDADESFHKAQQQSVLSCRNPYSPDILQALIQ